jgi:DNA-binding transcriptional regulator PaaX
MKKISQKKVSDAFYQLRKRGLIRFENKGGQIYIYLTEKGKKFAGILQIDELKIKNSKKWDKKWRILIFDIAQLKRIYREAFRGKLKELGFYQLQKSVLDSSLRLQSRS